MDVDQSTRAWQTSFQVKPIINSMEKRRLPFLYLYNKNSNKNYGRKILYVTLQKIGTNNKLDVYGDFENKHSLACRRYASSNKFPLLINITHFYIRENTYELKVTINETNCKTLTNTKPVNIKGTAIYASSPWHQPADVVIGRFSFQALPEGEYGDLIFL